MLNTSDEIHKAHKNDNECGMPIQQRKQPIDTSADQRENSHDSVSPTTPATSSSGQLSSHSHGNKLLQNRTNTIFIQDLLEDLLSCATSRSTMEHSDAEHLLRKPTGEPTSRPSTHATEEEVDKAYALTKEALSLDSIHSDSSSASDTDSSTSDSEDDATLLTNPVDEPDGEADSDALLATKHEQDTSKLHIPRPDFVITGQHTLLKVGTISAVLDDAVVVTTFNLTEAPRKLSDADICNATALDTGSLLCFSDGTVLGAVFETFGPVASPLYVVRFNNSHEIPKVARVGVEVMYVEQEMRLVRGRDVCGKGYDASGKDDEEAYVEEFSDDEMERRAKKKKRSGVIDSRVDPLKRARGFDERQRQGRQGQGRHGRGQHERAARQREGCVGDRERSRCHRAGRRRASGPTEGAGHAILRGYNPGVNSYYQNAVWSQAHALMPQPNVTYGNINNRTQSAGTIPSFCTNGTPLSIPSPSMNPPGVPGSVFNTMLQGGNYGNQVPLSQFPASAQPYAVSSAVLPQPQFAYPEQPWRPQVNPYIIGHNAPQTSTHQQYNTMQGQTPELSITGPPQFQYYQDQRFRRSRGNGIGEVRDHPAESHDASEEVRLQRVGNWQTAPNERYHSAPHR